MNGTFSKAQVEDLVRIAAEQAAAAATANVLKALFEGSIDVSQLHQQPQAAAPARRQSRTTPAKPVSKAQHHGGIEVAFGIAADGSLSKNQQSIARRWFLENHDYVVPGKVVTMRSIVKGIQDVNAALRAENETKVYFWAVWNAPKGRLSDYQARLLLRSSK